MITFDDKPVLSGTIKFGLSGAMISKLFFSCETDMPSSSGKLKSEGFEVVSAIVRSGESHGKKHVILQGGNGKVHTQAKGRSYRKVKVRTVLSDLAKDLGLALSPAIEESVISKEMQHYVVCSNWRFGEAFDSLAEIIGVVWRVLDNGLIWLGVDSWQTSKVSARILSEDPVFRNAVLAVDSLTLRPGQSFEGRKIDRVTYEIAEDQTRAMISYK